MIKVLIVEDSELYIKVQSRIYEDILNYELSIARNINEAKIKLKNENFDIILLDLNLPDGNGSDIVDYLRKELGNKKTYIIVNTTEAIESIMLELYNKGIDYYITKPFNPAFLKAMSKSIENRIKMIKKEED